MRILSLTSVFAVFIFSASIATAQTLTMQEALAMLSRSATAPATFVAGQVLSVEGTIKNLKPGSSVRLTSATSTKTGCTFRPLGALPSGTVSSDGSWAFTVKGFFGPERSTGKCVADLKFSGTLGLGSAATPSFSPTFNAATPTVYTVTDTYRLATKYRFGLTDEHGTCSGSSNPGSHSVGFRDVGGDLSFNIRSGPAGTECEWNGKAWLLPNGMRLQSMQVAANPDGPCVVRTNTFYMPHVSTVNPATSSSGQTAGTNPNGAGAPIGVMNGEKVRLDCGITAINDRKVSVRVDSMTFSGPPGLTFP